MNKDPARKAPNRPVGPGADSALDLEVLIRSRYPVVAVDTLEEERLSELLDRVAQRLDVPLYTWSRTRGLVREGMSQATYDTADPMKMLAHLQAAGAPGVYLLADFHPYLEDSVIVRKLREVLPGFVDDRRALVLSGHGVTLPPEIGTQGVPYRLNLPDLEQIRLELREVVRQAAREEGVQIEIGQAEAEEIARELQGLTRDEIRRTIRRAMVVDGRLSAGDVDLIRAARRESLGRKGVLEFVPITDPEPVGGMDSLREWLSKRRDALGEAAREFGLEPPRGVLLMGVQGCGKSLMARNIAAEWDLPLVRLDPSALYDKFVGETEKNLRQSLDTADAMSPVVLWIDEIEKGFARDGGEADGGVSGRLLGTFLTWLQERDSRVFVVATANDVERLPPELLRKGRFDEVFFVDLPAAEERRVIFALHLARRSRDPDAFDLAALAERSEGFSGSEIEQAVVAGLYTAFARKTDLDQDILVEEVQAAVPLSVTLSERVQALRAWAQGRAVPAA
ncbi:MAG: AAA family ATPase [marine benthic group bacterium]|nr:AAA family ATPase [Candidatus Benthicola marisminoris]